MGHAESEPRRSGDETDLHEAYPQLSADQIDLLENWGERRPTRAGDLLYAPSDQVSELFVVLSGHVGEITDAAEPGQDTRTHGPGGFPGELGMLEGQPALLGARVVAAGEVLAVPSRHLPDIALQDSVLGETLLRAFLLRRSHLIDVGAGMRVIGSCYSPDTRRLLEFATRNRLPHHWIDVENDPAVEAFLRRMRVPVQDLPVIVLPSGKILRNPATSALAGVLGMRTNLVDEVIYDLLVVGAGPAGLAASVYGASDGLSVTTVDATAIGGQASTTSRIENYLGFPAGISGAELTERALIQAHRFGARMVAPAAIAAVTSAGDHFRAEVDGGDVIRARTVVVASGAQYRRLDVAGLDRFETANVYYEATVNERQACGFEPVAVVGGGNSAGQAAVFLAGSASAVYLLVRADDLGAKMSRYLAEQIRRNDRIKVMTRTQLRELCGDESLTSIVVEEGDAASRAELATRALFVFIGAEPRTRWLDGMVALDSHGFVLTGADLAIRPDAAPIASSQPILQTSVPGIFAAGDVRHGATRRVAAAMGEGAIAVAHVNQYLAAAGHAVMRR